MTKVEQDEITHEIVNCAMEVHKILGNGFQEVVYQRALSVEMNLRNIEHQREFEMPLFYKGVDVGNRRLEAYNLQTGLLINFGANSLQFKRLFNKKYKV